MLTIIKRLVQEEEGQGMTEYGLILALIAVVVIGVLTAMGTEIRTIFNDVIAGLGGDPVVIDPPP